jgi:hypothetical protein
MGLVVLGMIAYAASPANAQTTANGPYYAPPSWDQTLPSATRFIVLSNMGSNAVLDRETGLVWERSPRATTFTWANAHVQCIISTLGNRQGWRLPTLQELLSLRDPSGVFPAPGLPAGHPFILPVLPTTHWSATTPSVDASAAYTVELRFSGSSGVSFLTKTVSQHVWCVRGGQGVDTQ